MGVDEALETYAPWYDWECETPLYRAVGKYIGEAALLDPIKHYRKPDNKATVYQLLMDEWSAIGYPIRSKSVICSTTTERLSIYGTNLYRVIPIKENSSVAFCPTSDMWAAFNMNEMEKYFKGFSRTHSLNSLSMFFQQYVFKNDSVYKTEDIEELKKFLDNVCDKIKKGENEKIIKRGMVDEFFEKYPGGIFELLEKTISPNNPPGKNSYSFSEMEFVLENYNNQTNIQTTNAAGREAYTSEECLLIRDYNPYIY